MGKENLAVVCDLQTWRGEEYQNKQNKLLYDNRLIKLIESNATDERINQR